MKIIMQLEKLVGKTIARACELGCYNKIGLGLSDGSWAVFGVRAEKWCGEPDSYGVSLTDAVQPIQWTWLGVIGHDECRQMVVLLDAENEARREYTERKEYERLRAKFEKPAVSPKDLAKDVLEQMGQIAESGRRRSGE